MPETIGNWAIGKLKLTLWATHASNACKFRYHRVKGTCLDVKCARCVGPRLRLYFFIFFIFSTFSQRWTKLDKIEQNWSFTFWLSQLHFLIDFNHLKKNWAQLETNWGLLGKIGQIWEKLGGFWVVLGKFVTNWVAFGQNWANLRKIGGLLGRIGQIWEKLGLHSRLFYVIFFQLPHQAQLHIELQNAYPAGRCLI